jgi:hypothetical protein
LRDESRSANHLPEQQLVPQVSAQQSSVQAPAQHGHLQSSHVQPSAQLQPSAQVQLEQPAPPPEQQDAAFGAEREKPATQRVATRVRSVFM